MINTTKCDLCLFLHKMCCKMVWKFCEIEKSYWNWLADGPNSVRLYLTMWDIACMPITSRSQSLTPRRREKKVQNKQTNVREAHGPALSSLSEVITMLKGLEKHRTKSKARLNMKRPVVQNTKPHKIRITQYHHLKTVGSLIFHWRHLVTIIQSKYDVCGWLGRAMVLGSFQCRGVLLL